ncbi:hypothetical protein KTH_47510 [Thermosporothrix hazakensis]|uniref:Uncharacterized protein n=1 Tax=Thermosporothrix sp. COM3 TaxID=2490863 RepID=A0A455T322_9CHLR|nr:hypothetical protein KTC_65150 [Thermosporothrix sp. COM3]GCE49882.1 hypothetical protein KTH_47510 [Thermosporothrix hazakensis]
MFSGTCEQTTPFFLGKPLLREAGGKGTAFAGVWMQDMLRNLVPGWQREGCPVHAGGWLGDLG